jgi:hypothetical protein
MTQQLRSRRLPPAGTKGRQRRIALFAATPGLVGIGGPAWALTIYLGSNSLSGISALWS